LEHLPCDGDLGYLEGNAELSFDILPGVAKMLIEYRDRIAPKIISHRPTRHFVTVKGTPKSQATVAYLIASCLKRRAGIILTPHQFRHFERQGGARCRAWRFRNCETASWPQEQQDDDGSLCGYQQPPGGKAQSSPRLASARDANVDARAEQARIVGKIGEGMFEMSRKTRMQLPFQNWPAGDRIRWESAFKTGKRLLEQVARVDGALDRLRRYAQPLHTAHDGGFRPEIEAHLMKKKGAKPGEHTQRFGPVSSGTRLLSAPGGAACHSSSST
jgi:hypothetical protein